MRSGKRSIPGKPKKQAAAKQPEAHLTLSGEGKPGQPVKKPRPVKQSGAALTPVTSPRTRQARAIKPESPPEQQPILKRAGKKSLKTKKAVFKNNTLVVSIAGVLVTAALGLAIYFVFFNNHAGPQNQALLSESTPERTPGGAEPETRGSPPVSPPPAAVRSSPEAPPSPESRAVTGETPEAPDGQARESPYTTMPAVFPERVPEQPSHGSLVFVIDDAGNNLRDLEPFLQFPGPLTVAVLPGLPGSAEAARRVRAAGKEVFLHQPMESLGGLDPGPGAIFAGMAENEIRAIINRNLDEIWPVTGMNNHEGSRVSMDEKIMTIVLDICRERGILFLDSRTTADTSVPAAARGLGISIGERDVFLDNEPDLNVISGYVNTGLSRAEQKGGAIMIGHVHTAELAVLLRERYSLWLEQGFTLSTVSGFIKGGS